MINYYNYYKSMNDYIDSVISSSNDLPFSLYINTKRNNYPKSRDNRTQKTLAFKKRVKRRRKKK